MTRPPLLPVRSATAAQAHHVGESPFPPPDADDASFVLDEDPALDVSTCRDGSPLVIRVKIGRFIGDLTLLQGSPPFVDPTVHLRMPVYDVPTDYASTGGGARCAPRHRVKFNGHVVDGAYLYGAADEWVVDDFSIPIDWVKFPIAPGFGGGPSEEDNEIRIDIDTATPSSQPGEWCTAVDWVQISIRAARPVVFVHGIFEQLTGYQTWASLWAPYLSQHGLPYSDQLHMGNLGGIGANAAMIANEVAAVRQSFGVDRVNLVCHSKGGIDARQYAESHDDVDGLVQIGTPNGGSPVADVVQAALCLGPLGEAAPFLNLLAGPAGSELTTPSMATYNAWHGYNPSVSYTSLTAEYEPQWNHCWEQALRVMSGGDGDLIVPSWSARSLSYAEQVRAWGGGADLIHWHETSSATILSQLLYRVRRFGRPLPRAPESYGGTSPRGVAEADGGVPRTASRWGIVSQGDTLTDSLVIDASTRTLVTLLYPSGNLNLALTSPSGVLLDSQTVIGRTDVTLDESDILGGRMEVCDLTNPEIGVWRIRVSAPLVTEPCGRVGYVVSGWIPGADVALSGKCREGCVPRDSALVVCGRLARSGDGLAGADVRVHVLAPDSVLTELALHDDGVSPDTTAADGTYSGTFTNTSVAGTYRLTFEATYPGGTGYPPFSREAFAMASVNSGLATLTGATRDYGFDVDNNGMFDQLVVEVGVTAASTGTYRLMGVLNDAAEHAYAASVETLLVSGPQVLRLRFRGEAIYDSEVNGPFVLSQLRLGEVNGLGLMPVAVDSVPYSTAVYDYRMFEHEWARIGGTLEAEGVDTDANGLYDSLRVWATVVLDSTRTCAWTALLVDSAGSRVGFSSGSGLLQPGTNMLGLSFDGRWIGCNGVDGHFGLQGLAIWDGTHWAWPADSLLTSTFEARSFEGYIEAARSCWPSDPSANLPLSLAPWNQRFPRAVSDGLGGVIVTWCDDRMGIWAQRVGATGSLLWSVKGVCLSSTAGYSSIPTIVGDGAGGAIVSWRDGLSGALAAQRVSRDGVVLWAADGVALSGGPGDYQAPVAVADGSGGAIMAWTDVRSGRGDEDIYAQHVSAEGVALWTDDGVVLCAAAGGQGQPAIASDGSGGAVVGWSDGRSDTSRIYAQRVNTGGAIQWGSNGVRVSQAFRYEGWPTIVADGATGVVVAWAGVCVADTNAWGIYVQHLDADGVVSWGPHGVLVSPEVPDAFDPVVVADGAGGVILAWDQLRSIPLQSDIYAQHVSASGVPQWLGGTALCSSTDFLTTAGIVADGAGGAIAAWYDRRRGGPDGDIYAQRVSPSGVVRWTANGVVLCRSTDRNFANVTALVSDGAGGAIGAWEDWRWATYDIYAQRVDAYGALGGIVPTEVDHEPPAAVADLSATLGRTTAAVSWTAPGDDSLSGTAAEYDLRYAMNTITEGNFYSAVRAETGTPGEAGSRECVELWPLNRCHKYYFALKTRDDAGNWSPLSNVASGRTLCSGYMEVLCGGDEMLVQGGAGGGWVLEGVVLDHEAMTVGGGAVSSLAGIGESRVGTNSALGATAVSVAAAVISDTCMLRAPVASDSGRIALRLLPKGQAAWTLRGVEVLSVDHGPQEQVVLVGGSAVVGALHSLGAVVDSAGDSLAVSVASGQEAVTAHAGSTWDITGAGAGVRGTALFLEVVGRGAEDEDDARGIDVLAEASDGGWRALMTLVPCDGGNRLLVDSLPSDHLRLVFHDECSVERLALLEDRHGAVPQELALVHAEHSREGSVLTALGAEAGSDVVIGPGENLVLTYDVPALQRDHVRDLFLVVRGQRGGSSGSAVALTSATTSRAAGLPVSFALHQNQPNPFSGTTTVRFDLPAASKVELTIFDLQGRRVRTLAKGEFAAGFQSVVWDRRDDAGDSMRPSVYLCRLVAGTFRAQKTMVLLP